MPTWTAWCDGSAVPNPGRMGLGVVLSSPAGERCAFSRSPQGVGCNNEAEARAVMLALAELKMRGAVDVVIHSDNSVVVAQLGGGTADGKGIAAPIARLQEVFDAARELAAGFERFRIDWLPRSRNAEADLLARAALGVGPKLRKAKHSRR